MKGKKLLTLIGSVCLILTLAVLSFMAACAPEEEVAPIKIGVPAALSGAAAQTGIDIRNGIILAAKEKGTILGRPIEIIVEDSEGKPDIGLRKAEKLVFKDGCVAILGIVSSGVALSIAGIVDRLGVPIVTTNAMTVELHDMHPWVFRAGQLADDLTAVANVRGILADPDLRERTYYVLAHDYAWGHSCAQAFIELAQEAGIKIYNPEYDVAASDTADWSAFVTKIDASGADAMYSALVSAVLPAFNKTAYEFGLMDKIRIVAGASPSEAGLEVVGRPIAGIIGATSWSWDMDTPESNAFANAYWDEFEEIPPSQGCQSYVGAMMLFNAIDEAGSTDPQAIASALQGATYYGPYGLVWIAADNSSRNNAVLVETQVAPANPYGAKMVKKILVIIPAEEVRRPGLPE